MCHNLKSSHNKIPNKGKNKARDTEEESDLEILPRMEINYEDTKAVTRARLELKWRHIYPMIKYQKVPDVGLKDIPLHGNIMRSGIMKVAMHHEIFPCAKVIDWIFTLREQRYHYHVKHQRKIFFYLQPCVHSQSLQSTRPRNQHDR